jgi:hypothetical protein
MISSSKIIGEGGTTADVTLEAVIVSESREFYDWRIDGQGRGLNKNPPLAFPIFFDMPPKTKRLSLVEEGQPGAAPWRNAKAFREESTALRR